MDDAPPGGGEAGSGDPAARIPREEMAAASAALTAVIERIAVEPDGRMRLLYDNHLLRALGDARQRLDAWLAPPDREGNPG